MEMKICNTCKKELPMTEEYFRKGKAYKDGFRGQCKLCILDIRRLYMKSNKDKLRNEGNIYREFHPKSSEDRQLEYQKNKEYYTIKGKKYYQANKLKFAMNCQKREAKKRELPYSLTLSQWEQIKIFFNNRCAYCENELPLEQEHFIPLSKGGEYSKNNIICSCKSCNDSKRDREFFEWYPMYRFYSKEREVKILKYLKQAQQSSD